MEKTEHLELNKWAQTDRILMDDFNSDNDKLDAALGDLMGTVEAHTATLAQHAALLPKLGNCRIHWETYVGTGEDFRTFTFDEAPLFFWVTLAKDQTITYAGQTTSLFYMKDSMLYPNQRNSVYPDEDFTVSDGGKSIYYRVYNDPSHPMNVKDIRYCILALLAADEN